MKENINEHDMTKKMMDSIRNGFKTLVTEEVEQPETEVEDADAETVAGDDLPEPTEEEGIEKESEDTISPVSGDAVFNDELKKLQDTVNASAKITNFKIYPSDDNVMIEGAFLRNENENSGIHFTMALNAREVKLEMQGSNDLDDDVIDLLKKLKGYYKVWADEWYLKLTNEYKANK